MTSPAGVTTRSRLRSFESNPSRLRTHGTSKFTYQDRNSKVSASQKIQPDHQASGWATTRTLVESHTASWCSHVPDSYSWRESSSCRGSDRPSVQEVGTFIGAPAAR